MSQRPLKLFKLASLKPSHRTLLVFFLQKPKQKSFLSTFRHPPVSWPTWFPHVAYCDAVAPPLGVYELQAIFQWQSSPDLLVLSYPNNNKEKSQGYMPPWGSITVLSSVNNLKFHLFNKSSLSTYSAGNVIVNRTMHLALPTGVYILERGIDTNNQCASYSHWFPTRQSNPSWPSCLLCKNPTPQ